MRDKFCWFSLCVSTASAGCVERELSLGIKSVRAIT
jgi:hypothetical protein